MGDNAGDFPIGTKGKTLAERNGIIDAHKEDFGTTFVVFPNPAYGSWVSALAKGYQNLSPEETEAILQHQQFPDGEIKNLLISKEISVEQLAVWGSLTTERFEKRTRLHDGLGTRPQSLSRH